MTFKKLFFITLLLTISSCSKGPKGQNIEARGFNDTTASFAEHPEETKTLNQKPNRARVLVEANQTETPQEESSPVSEEAPNERTLIASATSTPIAQETFIIAASNSTEDVTPQVDASEVTSVTQVQQRERPLLPRPNPHPDVVERTEEITITDSEPTRTPHPDLFERVEEKVLTPTQAEITTESVEVESTNPEVTDLIDVLLAPPEEEAASLRTEEPTEAIDVSAEASPDISFDVDTDNLNFLMLGGSHTASNFGSILLENLNQYGEASRLAVSESSTHAWMSESGVYLNSGFIQDAFDSNQGLLSSVSSDVILVTKGLLESFVDLSNPNVVVIELMDNQLFDEVQENQESVRALIQFLTTHNSNDQTKRACFYVSGTHTTGESINPEVTNLVKQNFISDVLRPVLEEENCMLIDSMELLSEEQVQTTNGLALTEESSTLWAEKVSSLIYERLLNSENEAIADDCYQPENEEAVNSVYGSSFINSIQPLLKNAYAQNNVDPRLIYHRMIGEALGDPDIHNSSSGAYGIFQVLSSYFGQDSHEDRIKQMYEETNATTIDERRYVQVDYYTNVYIGEGIASLGPWVGCGLETGQSRWESMSSFEQVTFLGWGSCNEQAKEHEQFILNGGVASYELSIIQSLLDEKPLCDSFTDDSSYIF